MEKEKIKISLWDGSNCVITKSYGKRFTLKERELIEFVINEFEDKKDLMVAFDDYGSYCNVAGLHDEGVQCITSWLKDRK